MSNLPLGAENHPHAPYNEDREWCPFCGQELIQEDGEWVHEFGSCPASEVNESQPHYVED